MNSYAIKNAPRPNALKNKNRKELDYNKVQLYTVIKIFNEVIRT